MKTNEDFLVMFKVLELLSVYSTPQFRKDIKNSAVLLNAFNEDGGKTKGKGSYNFNIERAIKTYLKNQ